jgi:hypothetical protein
MPRRQRKQYGRNDADENACGQWKIEGEVAATDVDVAGELANKWDRRESPQQQSKDDDRDSGEDQAFSYRRHRSVASGQIVQDWRFWKYKAK